MGLTIHYEFEFEGSEKELLKRLSIIREQIKLLKPLDVGDLIKVEDMVLESGYGKYNDLKEFYKRDLAFVCDSLLRKHDYGFTKYTRDYDRRVKQLTKRFNLKNPINLKKLEKKDDVLHSIRAQLLDRLDAFKMIMDDSKGFVIPVDVAERCEWFEVKLVRIIHDAYKKYSKWMGYGFTKTQYAKDFINTHLKVINILDICKSNGILKSVSDEGDYYETRNMNKLLKNINEYSQLLVTMTNALSKVIKDTNLSMKTGGKPQFFVGHGQNET